MHGLNRFLYLAHYDCRETFVQNEHRIIGKFIHVEQSDPKNNLYSLINTKEPIDQTYVANRGPKSVKEIFFDGFYVPPNLLNTKKPKPPEVRPYFKQSGTKVSSEPMQYTRYEGKDKYKTYYFNSDEEKRYRDLYNFDLEKWNEQNSFWETNKHGILDLASFGSYLLLGPYGPIVALLFEGVNIALYVKEGDDYEAGLRGLFMLLPFGELARRFKPVAEMGESTFKKFVWEKLSKKKGGNFSNKEMEVVESLSKGAKWIESKVSSTIIKKSLKLILKRKTTLRGIVNFIWFLSKKYPKSKFILQLTVTVGGVLYTWAKLAEIFGISKKSDNKEKIFELESEWNKVKSTETDKISEVISENLGKVFNPKEITDVFLEVFKLEKNK